jgi:hypothetical protein
MQDRVLAKASSKVNYLHFEIKYTQWQLLVKRDFLLWVYSLGYKSKKRRDIPF